MYHCKIEKDVTQCKNLKRAERLQLSDLRFFMLLIESIVWKAFCMKCSFPVIYRLRFAPLMGEKGQCDRKNSEGDVTLGWTHAKVAFFFELKRFCCYCASIVLPKGPQHDYCDSFFFNL